MHKNSNFLCMKPSTGRSVTRLLYRKKKKMPEGLESGGRRGRGREQGGAAESEVGRPGPAHEGAELDASRASASCCGVRGVTHGPAGRGLPRPEGAGRGSHQHPGTRTTETPDGTRGVLRRLWPSVEKQGDRHASNPGERDAPTSRFFPAVSLPVPLGRV